MAVMLPTGPSYSVPSSWELQVCPRQHYTFVLANQGELRDPYVASEPVNSIQALQRISSSITMPTCDA